MKKISHILYSNNSKSQFAKGSVILGFGLVFENGLRFMRNIILTRIIAPEYFGLMATIIAVIHILQALTEVGIRHAIIQNKDGLKEEFLNIGFWFSVVRGLFLFLLAFIFAPFISNFYSAPNILLPLRITFLALIFNGLVSPRMYTLEKELKYVKWMTITQLGVLLGVSTTLIISIYYKNIWPLVIGLTSEYFAIFILSYVFVPFKPKFELEKNSYKSLIKFVQGMFGLPILTAIFQKIDVFTIGKVLTMSELGLYFIAQNLANAINMAFGKIVRPLFLPLFAKNQDNKELLQKHLLIILRNLSSIFSPFILFTIIFSKSILVLFFGFKYGGVYLTFSILMLVVWIRLFSTIIMQLYFAVARPDLLRNFVFIRMIVGIALIYPALKYLGLPGAALTVLIGMIVLFCLQILWIKNLIAMSYAKLAKSVIKGNYLSFVLFIPIIIIKYMNLFDEFIILFLSILILLLIWIITLKELLLTHFEISFLSR